MMQVLAELGIRLQDMIAGFTGGVCYAFAMRQSGPWEVVGSVVLGTFTANYLGEYVAKITQLGLGAASFVTGLGAMALCQGIIAGAKRWRLPGASGGNP